MTTIPPLTAQEAATRDRIRNRLAEQDRAEQEKLEAMRRPLREYGEQRRQAQAEAERQRQAARDAERAAKEQATHEALARKLRDRFLAAGGTSERWEKEKDGVIAAHLQQAVLAGDEAARVASRRRYS